MLPFIPLHFLCTSSDNYYTVLNDYQQLYHSHHMDILQLALAWGINVGFIHICSHACILHITFHSLSLLIRSSSVSAITTRSSAYNSYGKATLNSLDKASMTITNSKVLNAEPWCIPTFTSKPSLLPQTVLTTVFEPVYIETTADSSYFSTPNLHIAYHITSLRTISKAFSKYTKPK